MHITICVEPEFCVKLKPKRGMSPSYSCWETVFLSVLMNLKCLCCDLVTSNPCGCIVRGQIVKTVAFFVCSLQNFILVGHIGTLPPWQLQFCWGLWFNLLALLIWKQADLDQYFKNLCYYWIYNTGNNFSFASVWFLNICGSGFGCFLSE